MYRIFIGDDHTLLRDGLKRILEENARYKVIGETGDGLEVPRQVRKLKPNMVILDISMPNLRGIEAIRKIRRFDKKVSILILTMHKNEDYVYDCLVKGAQGYLLKEDADKELLEAIRAIRHNRLYVSSTFSNEVIRRLIQQTTKKRKKRSGSALKELTQREREVLKIIAEGNSNKKAASKLGISVRTIEHHRLSIMRKINAKNAAQLIKYAIRVGLIDLT